MTSRLLIRGLTVGTLSGAALGTGIGLLVGLIALLVATTSSPEAGQMTETDDLSAVLVITVAAVLVGTVIGGAGGLVLAAASLSVLAVTRRTRADGNSVSAMSPAPRRFPLPGPGRSTVLVVLTAAGLVWAAQVVMGLTRSVRDGDPVADMLVMSLLAVGPAAVVGLVAAPAAWWVLSRR